MTTSKSVIEISATEINAEHKLAQQSAESAVEHAIRCGELLKAQKQQLKHGEWKPWIEANCEFSYASAAVYMKAANQKSRGLDFSSLNQLYGPDKSSVVTKYTGKGDWKTPEKYTEKATEVLKKIDLDPASSVDANASVKAENIFTEHDSGLDKEWHGNVFLNPPYDSKSVKGFVDKLADEIQAERVNEAILLTNNSTDTQWWQKAARLSTAICFTAGRINFHDDTDRSGNTNGQTFMYFGDDVKQFAVSFRDVGWIAINDRALNSG